jgi:hypothetical protein
MSIDSISHEFPRMKSIEVVVEERQVALRVTPDTWRTHVFKGLEAVPDKLHPAFGDGDGAHELDLLDLVRKSYRSGRVETRYEVPYRLANGSKAPTVLRSVNVIIRYQHQRTANAVIRRPRTRPIATVMPTYEDGVWSCFELQKAEAEVARLCKSISNTAVSLAVRLVKLEVRPSAGTRKLVKQTLALIHHRVPRTLA